MDATDEFTGWLNGLPGKEQEVVGEAIERLETEGPNLPFPMSSGINGSRHSHMRELRIQHRGRPLRVLYAFDPRRTAILLLGGDKTGMIGGTSATSRSRMICMTRTCESGKRRG